ncbi:MAG: NIPSNAP family protein [Akkermansiaceae bacterium]|nr:NIPSNAP family protein [Akkermansiaceae bacterium]MCF7733770.1 NIPSNAP family protein [Akkermansiaceae bacterium]
MKTRTFILSLFTAASLLVTAGMTGRVMAADAGQPQYFELRVYTTKSEAQQQLISDYWQKAAVPAYNRLGVATVGVFTELEPSPSNHVYVLIPFASPAAYAAVPAQLAADAAYQAAGANYLNTPKSDPAYVRFESSLLVAFDGMKSLAVPPSARNQKPWVFELRTYESHSETMGINKVKMFNSGEIPLMQEVGLTPIFFGQTIVGPQMPNLIYMVSGEDQDAHKVHWKGFFDAPAWKKLIADPQYKDNVSKVISVFLKRTPASQI